MGPNPIARSNSTAAFITGSGIFVSGTRMNKCLSAAVGVILLKNSYESDETDRLAIAEIADAVYQQFKQ